MKRKIIFCLLMAFGAVSSVAGQETRIMPEAECRYTLPGQDWEWLDPQLADIGFGQSIVLTTDKKGLVFTLQFEPLKATERPTSRSFESFEMGMLSEGRMKKLAGKHLTFKGIPSYQMDVELPGGKGCSIRILYANDKFYYLQVANAFGPLDEQIDVESIFQGFDFTDEPRPVPLRDVDSSFEAGQAMGRAMTSLMALGVIMLVLAGGVYLLVVFVNNLTRRKTAPRRRERSDDDWDYQ